MGTIVGAALVSHHPGLMQPEDFRIQMGAGQDSDLVPGFARLRERINAVEADTLVIFDSHWFTTGYHLFDAGEHYSGTYVSDEMPWYLYDQPYDYRGAPDLARLCEDVAAEQNVMGLATAHPLLPRHYATINVVNAIKAHERVLTVGTCQNCKSEHFLESGRVLAEAIRRSDARVVLLASGALSHKFNGINWVQKNPRIYDPENVSSPENVESDREAIALMEEGRHDVIVDRFPTLYRKIPWEGFGGHYLQMIGALGGRDCRAKGETLSEYENARGTGNIHMWFEV
ncbi:extradiol ring-cleavage dioxygenase [Sphingobium sp. Cam5-1]|uniref:DODA-type extradiol aromatic ring-opening family dioxygenase n=1 Tax=Sphingobium sp. Cam5-1 TaxID=2789327 RepID=UPI0018AD1089|nr:extradiol ring-cleavage dioxygenase [Sphingobium sp. Cam5-1]QPI74637.1 extradiol ring-cleavage dioxygenase [Sphingobium sp. Cam5-1]